jgi:hypothetical protein
MLIGPAIVLPSFCQRRSKPVGVAARPAQQFVLLARLSVDRGLAR